VRTVIALALALYLGLAGAQQGEERAPFITTPADVVERMLDLAGTGAGDLVVDLGSGDGRIVITAARNFGARALGIEIDEGLVARSRENARLAGVAERATFVRGDVLLSDISQASVVTVYLLPQLIDRLQPRFLTELRPGTRIVSHAFAMVGWKPDRERSVRLAQRHRGQGDESALYLWIVPAEARGEWRAADVQLKLHQNYQQIEVEGRVGDKAVAGQGSLSGRDIGWEGSGARFRGRVEGDRMVGELSIEGRAEQLVLTRVP
jgi:SAM-dependent methyltransferase